MQKSTCLCLLSAEITGMHHHAQHNTMLLNLFWNSIFNCLLSSYNFQGYRYCSCCELRWWCCTVIQFILGGGEATMILWNLIVFLPFLTHTNICSPWKICGKIWLCICFVLGFYCLEDIIMAYHSVCIWGFWVLNGMGRTWTGVTQRDIAKNLHKYYPKLVLASMPHSRRIRRSKNKLKTRKGIFWFFL